MPTTLQQGIEVDEQGVAFIAETGVPVEQIAEIQARTYLSSEEIQTYLPYLTREQVQVALAYYDAHRTEIDASLQAKQQKIEQEMQRLRLLEQHLPTGQNWLQGVVGSWPGEETDSEILEALERLS